MSEEKTLDDFNAAVDEVKAQSQQVDELKDQAKSLETALAKADRRIQVLESPRRHRPVSVKEWARAKRDPGAWADLVEYSLAAYKHQVLHDPTAFDAFRSKYPVKNVTDMTGVQYNIPVELYPEIWRVALQGSVFLRNARRLPTTTDTLQMPDRESGHTCYVVGRGVTITDTPPTYGQIAMPVSKLACAGQQGIEAFDDSSPDLASFLMNDAAEALGAYIDQIGFTDAAGAGEITGYTGVLPAATNEVDITANTFAPTFAEIWAGVGNLTTTQLMGAAFYCSPYVWSKLNAMVDSQGQPIWTPTQEGDAMGRFCGFPLYIVDAMPGAAAETVSTSFLLFGNLGYWPYADRQSFSFYWDDSPAFLDHARTWKGIARVGFPDMTNAAAVPACFVKWTTAAA